MNDTAQNVARALTDLRTLLGDRISESRSQREHHSHDESWHDASLPDAVCYPTSVEEVSAILASCSEHKVPIVPFGTGTGMEGGTVAVNGGISVDVSRMDQIIAVHAEDLTCTVQAGVTRKQLNSYLRDTGLYFPIDPGADASKDAQGGGDPGLSGGRDLLRRRGALAGARRCHRRSCRRPLRQEAPHGDHALSPALARVFPSGRE